MYTLESLCLQEAVVVSVNKIVVFDCYCCFTRPLWAAQLGLPLGPYPHLAVEESVKNLNI